MEDNDEEDGDDPARDAARATRIRRAMSILAEDFEAVQIVAIPKSEDEDANDQVFVDGFGSSLARAGATLLWLNKQGME